MVMLVNTTLLKIIKMSSTANVTPVEGQLLVSLYELKCAGCSTYPQFAIFKQVTSTGKWKIQIVGSTNIDHPNNYWNSSGSLQCVVPNSKDIHDTILTNKSGYSTKLSRQWELYDSTKSYFAHHDNGD